MSIPVSLTFGIVIRRAALDERNVTRASVLVALESGTPLAEDEHLMSFGPVFGGEALTEFSRRLGDLGLRHVDDFMDLMLDHPDWLSFRAEGARKA